MKNTCVCIAKKVCLFFALVALLSTSIYAAKYNVDKSHSSVGFITKHLLVSDVDGAFEDYDIDFVMVKENIRKFNVDITAKSVDTRNQKRDKHLRSKDFFNVSKYPKITFRSKGYKRVSATEGMAFGDLTIKNVTKRVVLNVKLSPPTKFKGKDVYGISMESKINRKEFKVGEDFSSVTVADEVRIKINLQVKK